MTLQRRKSLKPNDVIHDQFIILGKLDNIKHSSKLYKGFDKISRTFVVVKITSAAYKEKNKYVTKILQKLKEGAGTGVPTLVWRGEIAPDTITVTECLGPNLKKLFMLMDKQFSIATISMVAIQVLNTLEYIHSHDYVCCNIMPKEILISLHKKALTLFITDYKQARKVKSGRLAATDNVSHTANKAILNKFSSVNLHLGLPASKKDDLESLGYILVYFFKHGPIFEKKTKNQTREDKIKSYEQQKLSLVPETFCQGLPQEMVSYMSHIKSMQTNQTNEKIDYDYLRKLFRGLFNKHSSTETFQYDWISKARTYNTENGKRMGDDRISQEPSLKSDLISLQSPMYQGSDVLTDFGDNKDSPLKKQPIPLEEYDAGGMDEFSDDSYHDQPISSKFSQIHVFHDKIKTIEHIKSRSLHNIMQLDSNPDNIIRTVPRKKTAEDNPSIQIRIPSSTSTSTSPSIIKPQTTVSTPKSEKVDKMSSFGKTTGFRNKSVKAR